MCRAALFLCVVSVGTVCENVYECACEASVLSWQPRLTISQDGTSFAAGLCYAGPSFCRYIRALYGRLLDKDRRLAQSQPQRTTSNRG